MSTTTIRLSDSLKSRIANAAKLAGTTPHNLILEMLEEKVDEAERRAEFHRVADERWADFLANGETIGWEEMRDYLLKRAAGVRASPPKPRKFMR